MIELLLCSLVTILPDYLYRRYRQGKRFGKEINFFTVWFELRWGIVSCLTLTVALITVIFYYHPSTKAVTAVYRTISIMPEAGGRVAEIYVGLNQRVEAGQPLFRLVSAQQEAALETARRTVQEIDAAMEVAKAELATVDGQIRQAEGAHRQAQRELETKLELRQRSPNTVAAREVEKLEVEVDRLQGAIDAAVAGKLTLQTRISALLPAQKATAEAAIVRAQVDLDRTLVRADVSGIVQQFALRPGEIVNPMLRSAGVLVPTDAQRRVLAAGFDQIEAQVIRKGMIAEATCIGRPFVVIPMVVTDVQTVIASGQIRASDQVVDPLQLARPGTLTVLLEPLFPGGLDGVPPGGNCIANAYTNHHDELASGKVGALHWLFLHAVDAVAVVHAAILRVQAMMLPVQLLVFSGH